MYNEIKVGSKIKFEREKKRYTVRARNERYIICTKPYNLLKTVLYTIIDLEENVRGTENLIFGHSFESDQDCNESLERLAKQQTAVSRRNRVKLDIESFS